MRGWALWDQTSNRPFVNCDERTKGALAATNTALWELDLERRAVTWSANLDALFKRPIDNLEEGLQSVHPADEPRVRAACMATIEDHRDYRVECRVLWPDGTVRWVVSEGRVAKAATRKAAASHRQHDRRHRSAHSRRSTAAITEGGSDRPLRPRHRP